MNRTMGQPVAGIYGCFKYSLSYRKLPEKPATTCPIQERKVYGSMDIKNFMEIPEGYYVLSPKRRRGKTKWFDRSVNGCEYRIAEFYDGTTRLYSINTDGSITPTDDSVLVCRIVCPNCGVYLIPDADFSGRPDQLHYHCTACGSIGEIASDG